MVDEEREEGGQNDMRGVIAIGLWGCRCCVVQHLLKLSSNNFVFGCFYRRFWQCNGMTTFFRKGRLCSGHTYLLLPSSLKLMSLREMIRNKVENL